MIFAPTFRSISLVFLCTVAVVVDAASEIEQLNGSWRLDKKNSQRLSREADALRKEIESNRRGFAQQEFNKEGERGKSDDRFQKQAIATNDMIRESRSYGTNTWGTTAIMREILESESLKLYQAHKVVIMYDGETKRLLKVNPAGHAYSVSGTGIIQDDIGRTLTYFEDDALLLETETNNGGKVIERFEIADGPDRLRVTIRMRQPTGGEWLEFVRMFDRAD